MKVHLMFRDKDFNIKTELCFGKETLENDLELKEILKNMAGDDQTIYGSCESALFSPLQSLEEIRYRQKNIEDALQNADAVRELYNITVDTEKERKKSWYWLSSAYLSSTFSSAVDLLKIYTNMLMKLRIIADNKGLHFHSDGFINLFTMLQKELEDTYFDEIHVQLDSLKKEDGLLVSSNLGDYLQGVNYVLREKKHKRFVWHWLFSPSYTLASRDDAGAKDLSKRSDRAINEATNALAQSAEHLNDFFTILRNELAFYVGCLNLAEHLKNRNMKISIPILYPLRSKSKKRVWKGLYDISLSLMKNANVVGNELDTNDKSLFIITGANQGGKSTFLRSIGQAQLMAQSGLFVGAENFCAPICNGIFSHFKKEEDSEMKSGKLDEELIRMSKIADNLESGSLMLFNESFAATNEREGSEIIRQITQALIENEIEVFSVTHLYTYAVSFRDNKETQFLRAQRLDSGERSFKIVPGEPLQTAFGEDLYQKILLQKHKIENRNRKENWLVGKKCFHV